MHNWIKIAIGYYFCVLIMDIYFFSMVCISVYQFGQLSLLYPLSLNYLDSGRDQKYTIVYHIMFLSLLYFEDNSWIFGRP